MIAAVCAGCFSPIDSLYDSVLVLCHVPAERPKDQPFRLYSDNELRDPVISRQMDERDAREREATRATAHYKHISCSVPPNGVAWEIVLCRLVDEGIAKWHQHLDEKIWYTDAPARSLIDAYVFAERLRGLERTSDDDSTK